MRHRVGQRKLGRVTEHRISLLRNQAEALLKHERIQTTMPKAKELRPFVERIITLAKRGLADGANGRALHARRLVLRDIPDQVVVSKLFDTIAPRFVSRPGGYTRILRLGHRRGDSAEVAQIELLGSEYNPALDAEEKSGAPAGPKKATVGGRIKAAAQRMRGRKEEGGESSGEGRAPQRGRGATRGAAGGMKKAPRSKKGQ